MFTTRSGWFASSIALRCCCGRITMRRVMRPACRSLFSRLDCGRWGRINWGIRGEENPALRAAAKSRFQNLIMLLSRGHVLVIELAEFSGANHAAGQLVERLPSLAGAFITSLNSAEA